jgi:hypothetical protein
MPSPISIDGSQLFNFSPVSTVDWTVIPPKLHFYWTQGAPFPAPFLQNVRFPAYDLLPKYEDWSDFQFETQVVAPGSIPFFLVDGFINATGDLGSLDTDFYDKVFELSFQNLSLMSSGTYPLSINCKITALDPVTGIRKIIASKKIDVIFRIQPFTSISAPLAVTFVGDGIDASTGIRNKMIFNFRLSGSLPNPQTIYCFPGYSDMIVTSDDLDLSYSVTNPSMGELSVGFTDLSALAIGQYEYSVFIQKNTGVLVSSVEIKVILNVLPAKPAGLSIEPEALEFDVVIGDELPQHQSLNISSDANWSIISGIPEWLYISQFSGFGNEDVIIVPNNFENLADGVYTANLVFLSDGMEVVLPVTMILTASVRNPFNADKLFFTRDEDYLSFNSRNLDTYIEITLQVRVFKINTNQFRDYERIYKLPLFKGKAKFHPGTAVHQLLNEIQALSEQVPSVDMNYTKSQYQPAQVLIKYREILYVVGRIVTIKLIKGETVLFQMIKGTSPYITNSKLALLTVSQQEFSRLTPNSILGISFTFPGTPYLIVKRNTVIIDELFLTPFSPAESEKIIYSYYRFLNGFDPGDIIEISLVNDLETRTQRFIVMQPGPESAFFLFENQNGLIEPFEFSGRRRVSSSVDHLLSEKLINLNATTRKVSATNKQSFIANTGQLLKTDHKIVNAIIKSENVWVSFDTPFGPYIKVDAITNKMVHQDTVSNEDDFDIEFNILENTDATIYPQ